MQETSQTRVSTRTQDQVALQSAGERHTGERTRISLYDEVTARIIAKLEAGRLPWVQPWESSGITAGLRLVKFLELRRGERVPRSTIAEQHGRRYRIDKIEPLLDAQLPSLECHPAQRPQGTSVPDHPSLDFGGHATTL